MTQSALAISPLMVDRESMRKAGWHPSGGAVALRTLPSKVVGWGVGGMAVQAVGRPGRIVIKAGWQPCIGGMASRTLPAIVIDWCIRRMAF